MELTALLERVRSATGPDRYADCHLWVIAQGGDARMHVCDSSMQDFVWERGIDGFWVRSVVKFRAVPKYTASIDAALALTERVLPGWSIEQVGWGNGLVFASVGNYGEGENYMAGLGDAPTAPLAILAATLSALIAKDAQP